MLSGGVHEVAVVVVGAAAIAEARAVDVLPQEFFYIMIVIVNVLSSAQSGTAEWHQQAAVSC